MSPSTAAANPTVEEVHQQMEVTREHLAGHLTSLEDQVLDMVHSAAAAVTDTIDSVKDSVQQTVATVQHGVEDTATSVRLALDLRAQVRREPWLAVGAAVALGYLAGCYLFTRRA